MTEPKDITILIGCEESQAVCIAFRELGFEAYSCDLQECSGGHPEWHYQKDIFEVVNMGWDCMIAFPPCTHLAVSGAAWFEQKRKDGTQQKAIDFFMRIANADIKHIAIENPVGIMRKHFRKPNQIINPYYFGDEARKKTCLWLKNLPGLIHVKEPNLFEKETTWVSEGKVVNGYPAWMFNNDKKHRSKTFPGIAQALAFQYGNFIKSGYSIKDWESLPLSEINRIFA
jgi:hypothetical protein